MEEEDALRVQSRWVYFRALSDNARLYYSIIVELHESFGGRMRLVVPLDVGAVVHDLKAALTRTHPEHPASREQRLFHAGADGSGGPAVLRRA